MTGSIAASSQAAFLSRVIPERHRPIMFLFWISASETGSWFSAFLTKQETAVTEPQPGDPPAFHIERAQTFGTNLVPINLAGQTIVEPATKVCVVVNNASASDATFTAMYVYETVD